LIIKLYLVYFLNDSISICVLYGVQTVHTYVQMCTVK
jgi:hypothetical protein